MGQQGSVIYGWRREKRWVLLNQGTSVKYHVCLRVSERRCVKVTIQPRSSSKHAVITPFPSSYTWEEEKKIDSGAYRPDLSSSQACFHVWFDAVTTLFFFNHPLISQAVWAVTLLLIQAVFAQDFSFETLQELQTTLVASLCNTAPLHKFDYERGEWEKQVMTVFLLQVVSVAQCF